jgi:hypothetical protein
MICATHRTYVQYHHDRGPVETGGDSRCAPLDPPPIKKSMTAFIIESATKTELVVIIKAEHVDTMEHVLSSKVNNLCGITLSVHFPNNSESVNKNRQCQIPLSKYDRSPVRHKIKCVSNHVELQVILHFTKTWSKMTSWIYIRYDRSQWDDRRSRIESLIVAVILLRSWIMLAFCSMLSVDHAYRLRTSAASSFYTSTSHV